MPYAQIEIRPRMQGFHRAILNGMVCASESAPPRPPGKLIEYPSRAAHARAHRRATELRRRDRRRARTGRAPIDPATYTRRNRMLPSHMRRQIADFVATTERMFRGLEQAIVPMHQVLQALGRDRVWSVMIESGLVGMQRRINETVYAAASASVPQHFETVGAIDPDGTTPEWTTYDDVRASPYITIDDLRRQVAEVNEAAAEQAARYRAHIENRRSFASGGVIHGPRNPDDDRIPVRLSPGEVWASPEMIRRHAPLLQALNGLGPSILHPLAEDVIHHDRWLGEGALERDETSSIHSTDSSGRGAVWSDLMNRIDDILEEEQ